LTHTNYSDYVDFCVSQFWRDGWRKGDGKIYQFAIRPTEAGVGVAQQILKACRTLAIDIVVFRSKATKPAPTPRHAYRGGGSDDEGLETYLSVDDLEVHSFDGGGDDSDSEMLGLTGDEEPVYRGAEIRGSMAKHAVHRAATVARERMEVAAGREVNQQVHPDSHDLDYWEDDPCAMFTLVPVNKSWADQVVTGGPTTQRTDGGAFSGIQTV